MADDAALYHDCLVGLRDLDRDRYLACLLMPADKRGPVASLYRFNAEIARIRETVSEPMVGEIRMQWWRDIIAGNGDRSPAGHPGADALLRTITRYNLPRDAFEAYLEARNFDLYDDPMPDRATLEGYAGETASTLLQLSALVLDPAGAATSADAAGHAGVAQTVAGILLLMPRHTARGQVYVPGDILAACGLDRERFLGDAPAQNLHALDNALVALGREHLQRARAASADMGEGVFPAFLPVALTEQVFNAAARRSGDPRRSAPQPPQWRRQWRLLTAAWRGRF